MIFHDDRVGEGVLSILFIYFLLFLSNEFHFRVLVNSLALLNGGFFFSTVLGCYLKLLLLRFYTFTLTKWGLRRGGLSHPTRISVTQISTQSHSLSALSVSHSILFHTLYDMAVSTGLITSTTFLSGEASSLAKPPFTSSPLRFAYPNFPANLRMVRSPTLAAVSKQATTTPREPRGIMKPRKVSPEMEALVGVPEISRTQALKLIWAHIKGNNLQVYPDFFIKFQFLSIPCVSC